MVVASRAVLAIFMFCLCQRVTGESNSAHGNRLGGRQDQVPRIVEDQRYHTDTIARFPHGIPDLVPPTGSKDEQKSVGKMLSSRHKDSQVMVGKPTVTSSRNRNIITHASEGDRPRHLPTTALAEEWISHLPTHQLESSLPTQWSTMRPAVAVKRLKIELDQSMTGSNSLNATVPTSWIQNLGASSKVHFANLSQVVPMSDHGKLLVTDVNFVNETDMVKSINETDTVDDYRQEYTSSVRRAVEKSSSQLSHTTVAVISQKDKAYRKNAEYFKNSKQSNTNRIPIALDQRPVSRQPVTNSAAALDSRPASRQPITNSTSTALDHRPVSTQQVINSAAALDPRPDSLHHNSRPAQPPVHLDNVWEGDSNTSMRTASSAVKETGSELTDAQAKKDGDLEYEDAEEEGSNDTSTCPTCSKNGLTEEQVKEIRIEMFKELLAQKMRIDLKEANMQGAFKDARTRAHPPKLPQAILEQTIKDNVEESQKDQFYARDQEIIIAGEDLGRDCPRSEVTGCYRFHIKDKIKQAVAEAQLWFYKLKDVNDIKGQTFRVIAINTNSSRPQQGPVVASKDGLSIKEGWVQMDVTEEIHNWLNTGRTSHVLAIRCPTCRAKSYTSLFGIKQRYKPLLVVKYATRNQVSRGKRSRACDPVSECCKRDLVVSFHDVNMVEVYEPRNLSIGYCFGSCTETHQFPYNHTVLKERVRMDSSLHTHPTMSQQLRPCCVPLVLKDTFLITIENSEYIRKIVPKVIVETCGCM